MSVDASGKFGGAMVFGKWKGRNYVRQLVTPANPKSAMQTGTRAMLKFLAQIWATLSANSKATWGDIAASRSISAFNAFVGHNLTRWQEFLAPTTDYPAAAASTALTVSAHTYTGGQGFATLSNTPSAATNILGFVIFRDTSAITAPNWNNAVAVVKANGANPVVYTDAPLAPGTYHYRAAVINVDGVIGTVLADATAVVT
jgi:hypothetical protein